MGDLNGIIQGIMELIVAAIVGVIFYSIKSNGFDEDESGQYLKKMYIVVFGMLIFEAISYLIRHNSGGFVRFYVRAIQFGIYEANLAMEFLYLNFLRKHLSDSASDENKIRPFQRATYIDLYVGAIILVINLFVKFLYDFDLSNRIVKTNFYFLYLLVIVVANVLEFVLIWQYRSELRKRLFFVLASYCFLPFLAVIFNFFSYGISFGTFSIVAALAINFEYLMRDDGEDDEEDLDNMIPFEVERAHVENFIELQQEVFGDKIQVEWEVKVTNFRMPPLSLQKLVENAIRYGISKKPEGGLVVIKVEEKIGEIVVSVADDGRGFDTRKMAEKVEQGNSAHTGLLDVDENLRLACNGRLEVSSAPNVGTLAKIFIPR